MTHPLIHSTAIIHPKAQLDSSVEVGAFSIIGENVKIGKGTKILAHACIEGYTTIGSDNEIGSFSVIGGKPQDLKYKNEPTRLEIGDRNQFRECVTLNTGTVGGGGLTKIGSDCLMMAYCHVAHDCVLGDHVVMANYTGLSGHVAIEDWVIISGMCGISQFIRIGKHAFIGGMTGIRKDVVPFAICVGDPMEIRGINRVGLSRRGYEGEKMKVVSDLFKIYFDSNLEKDRALQEIEAKYGAQEDAAYFSQFIRQSKIGIGR